MGTCQHELMHALGTIHEQSRPDRDAHVKIIWSNIREGKKNNVFKCRTVFRSCILFGFVIKLLLYNGQYQGPLNIMDSLQHTVCTI